MMRTLNWGICQCIKYVVMHLRVKCNYTDTERGKTCLESCSGREENKELFLFFLSELSVISELFLNVEAECHFFIPYEFLMHSLYVCFFSCDMQAARFYSYHY